MLMFSTFGISLILLVISLSLKTVMLSLKVVVRTVEATAKRANKLSQEIGVSSGAATSAVGAAVGTTAKVAKTTVKTVQKTGKAAVNTAKTTGKVAKATGKLLHKTGKLSVKALKLAIRALQAIIHVLHTMVAFLLSLGLVGIVILIVIALFLIAAIAGALTALRLSPDGTGFVIGGSGNMINGLPVTGGISGIGGGLNPGISNPGITTPGAGVVTPGDTTALYNACKTMGEWYLANVKTYAGGTDNKIHSVKWYECELVPMRVGDECGRFAAAYGAYVSGKSIINEGSLRTIYKGSKQWEDAGWKYYTMDEIGGVAGLLPGDVMMCSNIADPCSRGGHAEVYLAPNTTFGWGQIQKKFPSNTSVLTNWTCSHGHTYVQAGTSGHRYGRIFRYAGG